MVNAPGKLPAASGARSHDGAVQKVVVVNGNQDVLELLETVLDAGRYDVMFVDSAEHAYSQIRRVKPNVVILCLRIEDLDGFQVLSMLKMDPETRAIPVLTYTTEGQERDAGFADPPGSDGVFTFRPVAALRMN